MPSILQGWAGEIFKLSPPSIATISESMKNEAGEIQPPEKNEGNGNIRLPNL